MSTIVIPLDPDLPHQIAGAVLDRRSYVIEKLWNGRESAWYLSLRTEQDVPIWSGIKVVVDFPLGVRCRDPLRPRGQLVCIDTSGKRENPGLTDLGARHQLHYFEAE